MTSIRHIILPKEFDLANSKIRSIKWELLWFPIELNEFNTAKLLNSYKNVPNVDIKLLSFVYSGP